MDSDKSRDISGGMSWTPVDFSLVRYSPIEGTHFFYDHRHPSSIQFLLSGGWESWDVGWVKYKAQDADIRQLAADAEDRLVQDPRSAYTRWPSQPPAGPPAIYNGDDSATMSQEHAQQKATAVISQLASAQNSNPVQSGPAPAQAQYEQYNRPNVEVHHASPYETQGLSKSNEVTSHVTSVDASASQAVAQASDSGAYCKRSAVQNPMYQPVAPTGPVLSRTRETKILLSLDGDGIRGLSALLLVESLVNAICVKVGQRLDPHQIFDLTGGNSLGGATAIMLCRLQMQAHRAREAYKNIARQVFFNKRDFFSSLDPRLPTQHVNGAALENEIKAIVKHELGHEDELLLDTREDSGDVFVVSTHIRIGTNKPGLMRSYQTRRITGPELDANMSIWQAMKATCIAPRYTLPQAGVHQRLVIEPGLVDHGTAKNNPVRDILYECRKLFRYTNDMMIIISIGTGIGMDRDNEIIEMVHSIDDRNAEARAWGEKFEADNQALIERGWMKYFRFNVTGLEDVPLEEWQHEDLIKERTSAYLVQPEVSARFYACVEAVASLMLGPQGR